MGRQLATETHCAHGHEWTPETTRWHGKKRPTRVCLICHRERRRVSHDPEERHHSKADPLQVAAFRTMQEAGVLDEQLMRLAGFELKAETAA